MADILLAKPESGQSQNIPAESGAKFVFDFPSDDGALSRDGDNLKITFSDDSSISIDNFYTEYNSDNLPSFSIGGEEVSAEDFFTAMNEPDLMPAAGPATQTPTQADGNRYHEYADMALMSGITHLEGLDWGMNRSFEWEEMPNSVGRDSDGGWAMRNLSALELDNSSNAMRPGEPGYRPVEPVRPSEPVTPDTPYNPRPSTPVPPINGGEDSRPGTKPGPGTNPEPGPQPGEPTIPDRPGNPADPDTPSVPGKPDTPDTPDTPSTPEDPDTPEIPQPGIEVPPATPGDPDDSDNPDDPENPGDPENPDNPDNPKDPENPDKPGDPDDPKDPDSPENPGKPDDPSNSAWVEAGGSTIIADEGALANGSGQHAAHESHGFGQVVLIVNGEGNGRADFTLTDPAGNQVIFRQSSEDPGSDRVPPTEGSLLVVNGVAITVTGATYNAATGNWILDYTYELTGGQHHDKETSDTVIGGPESENYIRVDLVDANGNSPAEPGRITVEVHDDIPAISADSNFIVVDEAAGQTGPYENMADGRHSLDGSFAVKFGADGANAEHPLQIRIEGQDGFETLVFTDGQAVYEVAGKGVLTITDKGDGNFDYSFAPAENTTLELPFTVKATDSDDDDAEAAVSVNINYKPTITPSNPGRDPENPDNPDNPDNPGNPVNPGVSVDASGFRVIVDEAAMAGAGKGAGDTAHGYRGHASFEIAINGQEGGVIEIGGGYKISISQNENGEWTATPNGDNSMLLGNGVSFTFDNATLVDAANGVWNVAFGYELVGNVQHGNPGSKTDSSLPAGVIPVKVTDNIGHDTASSQITVEIHDDAPVIGQANIPAGEKGYLRDGEVYEIKGAVPGIVIGADQEGANLKVKVGDAAYIGQHGKNGWIFTKNGEATEEFWLDLDGNFVWQRPAEDVADGKSDEYKFEFTLTDGDGDQARTETTVATIGKPTFNPDPDPTPDPKEPENPENPDNPDNPGQPVPPEGQLSSVVTDDSGLANGTTPGEANMAAGSLSLNMNGRPITVTIGEGDNSIVLRFDADGKLLNPEVKGGTAGSEYGELTLDKTSVENGVIKIDYEFTQTRNYEKHPDAADRDELGFAVDQIKVSLEDDLGQTDAGHISISIKDDAPEMRGADITNSDSELLDADAAAINGVLHGLAIGADRKGATLEVKVGDAVYIGKYGEKGWTFTKDGSDQNSETDEFRLDSDGNFVWQRPAADVADGKSDEYKFEFTLTDGDGDQARTETMVATIGKPTFNPDPEPTPDPDDPGNTKAPTGQLGSVVTDDSGLADGTTPGEGNKASGSLSFNTNGRPLTVTIGEGENSIVLKFDADGTLGKTTGDKATSEYGELKLGEISAENGVIKIDYEFTQTKNYQGEKHDDHSAEKGADELGFAVDQIKVSLEDDLGQTDAGHISISIKDDAPVVTAPDSLSFTMTEGQGGEFAGNGSGEFTYNAGADGEADKRYFLSFDETASLQVIKDGQRLDVAFETAENGQQILAKVGDDVAFRLSINDSGKVFLSQENGYGIYHDNVTYANAVNDAVVLAGIKANLTVTDGDGDVATSSQDVVITIEDTRAEFKEFTDGDVLYNTGYVPSMTIDFTTEEPDGSSGRTLTYGETDIHGSHIVYTFENGHITWIKDHGPDYGNSDGADMSGKLTLANKHAGGIGVGSDGTPNGADMGFGNENVGAYGSFTTPAGAMHAEGLVIDPKNGTVNYGLNLTLSNFGEGDRAVIAFYLTPNNCNDDCMVKYVEVDIHSAEYQDGKIVIDVPDGFTKAILAPIPTESGDKTSSFSLAKLEFTQPSATRTGHVEIDGGQDGVNNLQWDWSDFSGELLEKGVEIEGTLGAGHYEIEWIASEDGKTVEAQLKGFVGQYSHNGHTLFRAELSDDGHWEIDQMFRFTVDGQEPGDCNVKFTITDNDGSVTTADHQIDLTLDASSVRFDNVELGTYNNNESKDGGWGSSSKNDNAYDVLTGQGVNDLMYGRGGNDLMFGDDLDVNAFAKAVLGDEAPKYTEVDQSNLGAQQAGAHEEFVSSIYNKLASLLKENPEKLQEISELAEGTGSRGDDALFGGVGNDILFGGAGNDYLVGTGELEKANLWNNKPYTDSNMLFGGSGNDILVYNRGDVIEDGGRDVDILLVGKNGPNSLKDLLDGKESGAKVTNVEVMLKTNDSENPEYLGITSLESLAQYGILLVVDRVYLNADQWKEAPDSGNTDASGNDVKTYTWLDPDKAGSHLDLQIDHANAKVEFLPPDVYAQHVSGGAPVATNELEALIAMDGELAADEALEDEAGYLEEDGQDEVLADAIIVLNPDDYYIDGNDGVDFLIVKDGQPNMLKEAQETGKIGDTTVKNVNVVITGDEKALDNIPNVDSLRELGINLNDDKTSISLEATQWSRVPAEMLNNGDEGTEEPVTNTYVHNQTGLWLETTLRFEDGDMEEYRPAVDYASLGEDEEVVPDEIADSGAAAGGEADDAPAQDELVADSGDPDQEINEALEDNAPAAPEEDMELAEDSASDGASEPADTLIADSEPAEEVLPNVEAAGSDPAGGQTIADAEAVDGAAADAEAETGEALETGPADTETLMAEGAADKGAGDAAPAEAASEASDNSIDLASCLEAAPSTEMAEAAPISTSDSAGMSAEELSSHLPC